MRNPVSRHPATVLAAFLFTLAVLALGYEAFGFWTMLIFTSGFLGGFLLWLLFPATVAFSAIKIPYFLALALFILHRLEEYLFGFFDRLSAITGVQKPEIASWEVVLLLLLSVGAWLLIPWATGRGYRFGTYLAWTFFAAMGITELAHFVVFPWFAPTLFAYFPGMASVVLLAPVAWWGMWRLAAEQRQRPEDSTFV
jgi:hypothetical protein